MTGAIDQHGHGKLDPWEIWDRNVIWWSCEVVARVGSSPTIQVLRSHVRGKGGIPSMFLVTNNAGKRIVFKESSIKNIDHAVQHRSSLQLLSVATNLLCIRGYETAIAWHRVVTVIDQATRHQSSRNKGNTHNTITTTISYTDSRYVISQTPNTKTIDTKSKTERYAKPGQVNQPAKSLHAHTQNKTTLGQSGHAVRYTEYSPLNGH